jgi:hypothetical protein
MSLLEQQMKSDVDFAFLDDEGMFDVESVTYTPHNGTARTINALVERNADRFPRQFKEARMPALMIYVSNDATTGIEPDDVSMIGGTVSVSVRKGGTAEALMIQRPNPITQDAGMVGIALGGSI